MTLTNSMDSAILAHRGCWKDEHMIRAMDQLIEEMAELIVEISHSRRGREHNILEEIADVELCLEIVKDSMGIKWHPETEDEKKIEDGYRHLISGKANRLHDRLEHIRCGKRTKPIVGST